MARHVTTAVSETLAAAQEQLHRRRQDRRQERIAQQLPVHTDLHGHAPLPHNPAPSKPFPSSASFPGWESEALTGNMRAREKRLTDQAQREAALSLAWLSQPAVDRHSQPSGGKEVAQTSTAGAATVATFVLHPDLALAMLQNNLVATARVWFLLRHLDEEGCGWVSSARARQALTCSDSDLRLCGWRQLRNLFTQGDGIFWERNDQPPSTERIWLRSPARVAAALGIRRLRSKPVAVPLSILLQGIRTVRAHFYASFHSSRESNHPIARQTLAEVTGVARRSQHAYEKRAGVKKQHNWAVENHYSKSEAQCRAWQHGHAIFRLEDHQGKSGAAGESYLAWQMPNSYAGPHAPQTTTRKKRINRRLADLLNKGITGNGEKAVEATSFDAEEASTRYFEHGRAAARAYNRSALNDLYWCTPVSYGQYKVWHLLPAKEKPEK